MGINSSIVSFCLFGFMFYVGHGSPDESEMKQNITINSIIGTWNGRYAFLGGEVYMNYGAGCYEYTFSKYIPSSMETNIEDDQLRANATLYTPLFWLSSYGIYSKNESQSGFWSDIRIGMQLITFYTRI